MASKDWDSIVAGMPPAGARDANAAVAGTYGVTPAQGAAALNDGPMAGTPPAVGMRTPQQTADLAAQAQRSSVLEAHPAVASWVASAPPAHVAASKDSLPALGAVNYAADAWKGYSGPVDSIAQALKGAWEGLQKQAATSAETSRAPQYFGQNEVEFVKLLGSTVGLIGSGFAAGTDPLARAYASLPLPMFGAGDLQGKNPLNADQRIAQARADTGLALWGLTAVGGKAAPTDLGTVGAPPRTPSPPSPPITDAEFTDIVKPPLAIADQRVIEHLQETLANTDLHAASPSTMESFLSHALPDQTVGVDPEKLVELAGKGDEVFPERASEIAAAHADGADVEVPLSRYLAATAGQPFAGELNAATTFREGGVSTEEAKSAPSPESSTITALSNVTEQIRDLHTQMDALIPPSDHPHGHSYQELEPYYNADPALAELGKRFDTLDIARARLESQPVYEAVLRNLPPGWTAQRAIRNYTNSEVPGLRRHLPRIEVFNEHGKIVHGDAREQDVVGFRKEIEAGRVVPSAHEAATLAMRGEGSPANDTDLDELNALIEEFGPKPIKTEGVVKLKGDEFEGLTPPETLRAKSIAAAYSDTISRALEPYLAPLVKGPDALGMTKPQFERYSANVEALVERTQARAYEAARAQVMRERKPDFVEAAKQHSADAERELAARRDVQAQHALIRNTGPLGEPLERPPMKINREDALNAYGSQLVNSVHQGVFGAKGLHPDEVAELLGYGSGREMMGELAALHDQEVRMGAEGKPLTPREHLATLAKAIGHNRATEALGFDLSPEGIHEAASAMVHEPDLTSFLTDELRAMGATPLEIEDVKARAAERFANLTVKDARNIKKLEGNLYKTSRKLQDALQKGDARAAFIRAQQQFLHHLVLKDAHEFAKEIRKPLRTLAGVAKKPISASMDQTARNVLRWIAKQTGFNVKTGKFETVESAMGEMTLRSYIEARLRQGYDHGYTEVPQGAPLASYTVGHARELFDMVESIRALGVEEGKVFALGKVAQLADIASQIADNATAVGRRYTTGEKDLSRGDVDFRKVFTPEEMGFLKKKLQKAIADFGHGIGAAVTRTETPLFWLDREQFGPLMKYIVDPFNQRDAWKGATIRELEKSFAAFSKAQPKGWAKSVGTRVDIPELTFGRSMRGVPVSRIRTYGDVIMSLVHWGSEENLEKFLDGYGWDKETAEAALFRAARPEDWKYVQFLWDQAGKLWPATQELYRATTGLGLKEVRGRNFEVPGVGTMKGRYWHLDYDWSAVGAGYDAEGQRIDVKDPNALGESKLFGSNYRMSTPPNGNTKARVQFSAPMNLQLKSMHRALEQVVHDLAYRKELIQAAKILRHPDVKNAIDEALGGAYHKQATDWLARIARQANYDQTVLNSMANVVAGARRNFVISQVGGTVSTLIKHGGIAAFHMIGEAGTQLPGAIKDLLTDPDQWHNFVMENSGTIRNISNSLDRDAAEFLQTSFANKGTRDQIVYYSTLMFTWVKQAEAEATWLAVYRREFEGNNLDHSAAVALADKAVRDTQGSGTVTNLDALHAADHSLGGEFLKLATTFTSFMNTVTNRMWTVSRSVERGLTNVGVGEKPLGFQDEGWAGARRDFTKSFAHLMFFLVLPSLYLDYLDQSVGKSLGWGEGFLEHLIDGFLGGSVPGGTELATLPRFIATKGRQEPQGIMESALTSSFYAAMDAYNASAGHKVNDQRWPTHAAETAGLITGLPTKDPSRAGQYWWDRSNGRVPDDGTFGLKSVIMGEVKTSKGGGGRGRGSRR